MILLDDAHYLSEGLARKVFQHPDQADLCIKIGKPGIEREHLYKEIKYYEKLQRRRNGFVSPFFSTYYGEVETNMGEGFVYQLIKDEPSGNISQNLRYYLELDHSPLDDDCIIKNLQALKREMIENKVQVSDLRARNICCQLLNEDVQFVVVDGIGHRDFIPFADWFGFFAEKKIERRFLKANLHSLDAQRELLKRKRAEGKAIV